MMTVWGFGLDGRFGLGVSWDGFSLALSHTENKIKNSLPWPCRAFMINAALQSPSDLQAFAPAVCTLHGKTFPTSPLPLPADFSSRVTSLKEVLSDHKSFTQFSISLGNLSVFIHSSHTHFLSIYSVPGTVSGTGDTRE